MKNYLTFGQIHTHNIKGKTLDKDTVGVFYTDTYQGVRDKAEHLFGAKHSFHYTEESWKEESIKYYPKRYVELK